MGKIILATLAGALTSFILGFLMYGIAFADFFAANVGSATGVIKDPPNLAAIGLGQIPLGLFLALAIQRWDDAPSLGTGVKVGALLGLLITLSFDLMLYGSMNIQNETATLVDPLISTVMLAVTGGVVGLVLGRGRS